MQNANVTGNVSGRLGYVYITDALMVALYTEYLNPNGVFGIGVFLQVKQ